MLTAWGHEEGKAFGAALRDGQAALDEGTSLEAVRQMLESYKPDPVLSAAGNQVDAFHDLRRCCLGVGRRGTEDVEGAHWLVVDLARGNRAFPLHHEGNAECTFVHGAFFAAQDAVAGG